MSETIAIALAFTGMFAAIAAATIPIYLARKNYPTKAVQNTTHIVGAAEGVVELLRTELERLEEQRQEDFERWEVQRQRDLNKVAELNDQIIAMRAELGSEEKKTQQIANRMHELENMLAEYKRGVGLLIQQLANLGHAPAWQPNEGS